MSYSNKQWSFLKDVSLLITFIAKEGWKATGGDLYRSSEEQQRLYDKGYSKALPGQSRHNSRMAIDLNLWDENGDLVTMPKDKIHQVTHKNKLAFIGEYWKSLNPKNRWGGDFNSIYDPNHFERGD